MVYHFQILEQKVYQYFLWILSLLLIAPLLQVSAAGAQQISYDPYADSVSGSSAAVVDANNAVGAPNTTTAQMAGTNPSLTLDMGSGEEGTQTLRIYFGSISVIANITVDFLDGGQGVIKSETRQLGIDLNSSTQNFAYNWTDFNKAYRYVRISASIGGSVNIDAIEALGYIGSTPTQDTDGDGVPDRTEQQNGTNPLVADSSSSTPTPSSSSSPSGSSTTNNTTNTTNITNTRQVNPPPAASNDKDGDGIADDWERDHGLNPNDKNDADDDPDHDGLTNLVEYQINSDPQKADTDGDGMPDKWEYDNGLDVNKNDADGDPDGDYLTNLGEYKNGTDPNKADDLRQVFCDYKTKQWYWLLIALLLLIPLSYLLNMQKQHKTNNK